MGLSFSLVYIIALRFDWMNPYWAGWTIVMISTAAAGQSIHKGFLRIAGTIPGVIAGLVIFSFAAQDRWLFIILTASWVSFTTYMTMKDEEYSYLWYQSGYAALVILVTPITTSASLFDHAVLRALETIMGVVVYTAVMVFIWPATNINSLKETSTKLIDIQAKIFSSIHTQATLAKGENSMQEMSEKEAKLLNGLRQAFYAQGSESYRVQEATPLWKEFYRLSTEMMQALNRLNSAYSALDTIDIPKLFPQVDTYTKELERRFKLVENMFEKDEAAFKIVPVTIEIDQNYLKSLSTFDQITFASTRKELKKIEALNLEILNCTQKLVDDSKITKVLKKPAKRTVYELLTPDLEHLNGALYIGFIVFVFFIIWIYANPPGHIAWIQLPASIAMIIAASPQINAKILLKPTAILMTIALAIYILVMPALAGITQLGGLLFISAFLVFYYLDGIVRLVGLASIVQELPIENQQVYNFAAGANSLIFVVMAFMVLYASSYLLNSARPQRALLRNFHRFFKSAEFLADNVNTDKKSTPAKKFQLAFYTYELHTLPLKITGWSKTINHKHFPKNSPESITRLVSSLYTLTNSLKEWIESNHLRQTTLISQETLEDLDKWRQSIEHALNNYSYKLDSTFSTRMKSALNEHIDVLERSINKNISHLKLEDLSTQEKENFFQLLGSYQGLSLALISYAKEAENINWEHWKEEVFD